MIVRYAKIEGLFNHPTAKIEMPNPFSGLKIKSNKARYEVWLKEEVELMLEQCRITKQKGIETAIILAYWTAQRQTDILNLKWSDYDEKHICINQSKTGARVKIPVFKLLPLKKYLDSLSKESSYIVCFYNNKKQVFTNYKLDYFVERFLSVKKKVGIKNKMFRDFRRTSITKLAEAGCTNAEIASFSGHSHQSIAKMLDIYASRNSNISDVAGDKLMSAEKYKK